MKEAKRGGLFVDAVVDDAEVDAVVVRELREDLTSDNVALPSVFGIL
mgnify:CR=1 FL=1